LEHDGFSLARPFVSSVGRSSSWRLDEALSTLEEAAAWGVVPDHISFRALCHAFGHSNEMVETIRKTERDLLGGNGGSGLGGGGGGGDATDVPDGTGFGRATRRSGSALGARSAGSPVGRPTTGLGSPREADGSRRAGFGDGPALDPTSRRGTAAEEARIDRHSTASGDVVGGMGVGGGGVGSGGERSWWASLLRLVAPGWGHREAAPLLGSPRAGPRGVEREAATFSPDGTWSLEIDLHYLGVHEAKASVGTPGCCCFGCRLAAAVAAVALVVVLLLFGAYAYAYACGVAVVVVVLCLLFSCCLP
jgi:hypothetical protein